MSGAISAGAYTAGVVDFLIQALAEWEAARRDDPAIAIHDVRLVAMSGASAGGMTTAMTAVALAHGLDYTNGSLTVHSRGTSTGAQIEYVMPRLYEAWVVKPGMVAETDGAPDLLSLEDLTDQNGDMQVRSVLNSKALESIVDSVLAPSNPPAPPQKHSFLADPLHLYLTHTNLRGIPYEVSFPSDSYRMLDHADRRHFAVTGLGGTTDGASNWARSDPGASLDGACKPKLSPAADWRQLGLAALATGAFPAGLAPRIICETPAGYEHRQWTAPDRHARAIKPDFPASWSQNTKFGFVNVDGGLINNDPFEIARYCLLDDCDADTPHNPRDPKAARQAVIMISPFPEGCSFPEDDPLDTGLVGAITKLLPTLIQQARFKPSELAAAADPAIASRWLIAPRLNEKETPSSMAIACGSLGGFGGFLSLKFREHDFQLGRRNCQQFLREWFALPDDSAIKFRADALRTERRQCPIIPLHGRCRAEIQLLPRPKMSGQELDVVMGRIRKRANAVVPALLRQQKRLPFVVRVIARLVWWCYRRAAIRLIRRVITKDLATRCQYIP